MYVVLRKEAGIQASKYPGGWAVYSDLGEIAPGAVNDVLDSRNTPEGGRSILIDGFVLLVGQEVHETLVEIPRRVGGLF